MTHRRLLRRKHLKVAADHVFKTLGAEQSGNPREVFAKNVAQPQVISVRINPDSCFPVAVVASANQPDKGRCNPITAGPPRYALPNPPLHFIKTPTCPRPPT